MFIFLSYYNFKFVSGFHNSFSLPSKPIFVHQGSYVAVIENSFHCFPRAYIKKPINLYICIPKF